MHKVFYASGFLYHIVSGQILLHRKHTETDNASSTWHLFEAVSNNNEQSQQTFQRVVYTVLKIKVSLESIYPVYDYFHPKLRKNHYVVYAELLDMPKINPILENNSSWFTFKQIAKIPLIAQTKQDIIVAKRVIEAKVRSYAAQTLSLREPHPSL